MPRLFKSTPFDDYSEAHAPPVPRTLPPACILSCPDWEWVGSHFSRADLYAGLRDGTFPARTVIELDGLTWCVVRLGAVR